jgi:hypothetical protein
MRLSVLAGRRYRLSSKAEVHVAVNAARALPAVPAQDKHGPRATPGGPQSDSTGTRIESRDAGLFALRLVSALSWRSDQLREWLAANRAGQDPYRHLRLAEVPEQRVDGLAELARQVEEAHRDARERLERLMGVSLDPRDPAAIANPQVQVFPDAMATTNLQGYLGEILAGLVAENYEPHGRDWTVPAFVFRDHSAGAQAVERRRQLGGSARVAFGRFGDDAVAFIAADDGTIVAWLYAEAKCTHDHSRQLIHAGHEQLSGDTYLPVDLPQLIEILEQRGDADAQRWADALRLLFFTDRATAPTRFDLLVYVCGRKPIDTDSWLPTDKPAAEYTGGRFLEAVEVHLDDFDEILQATYPAHVIER